MNIRKMMAADVEGVTALGDNVDEVAVSEKSRWWGVPRLSSWVEADNDILLAAEEDSQIVGVILTQLHPPTKIIYISDVIVLEAYRGKGIGTALINAALDQAKDRGINWAYALTHTDNAPIAKTLTSQGFVKGEAFVWFEKKPL